MTDYTLTLSFSSDEEREAIQEWISEELLPNLPDDADATLTREDRIVSVDELGPSQYGRTIWDPQAKLPTGVLEGAYPLKTYAEGYQFGVVIGGKLYHASGFDVVKLVN